MKRRNATLYFESRCNTRLTELENGRTDAF